jgi:DNA-binding response OmpR family regulator
MSTILVVDDDEAINTLLKEVLQFQGYTVVSASDGQQALELFNSTLPDLVITDIIMPKADGVELVMNIRNHQQHSQCKIIAISGGGRLDAGGYLDSVQILGADLVMEKPFDIAELEKNMETLLQ